MIDAGLEGKRSPVEWPRKTRSATTGRFLRPQDYSTRRDYRPPSRWYRRLNAVVGVAVTCLGLAPRDAVVLETHGRATGRTRRTPVLITRVAGTGYLVALAGQAQWVRNVRADAGRARLCRRGHRTVLLEEIPPADRAPILHAYLRPRGRASGTRSASARQARYYFGVEPNPSQERLAAVAGYYPVFRIKHLQEPGELNADRTRR